MDHGRKIGRAEAPRFSLKTPKLPFVTVTDCAFEKDEPMEEDHRLINWKKWLKIHQKQYQALNEIAGHQTKRNIVMNSCEKIRPQTEMKNLTKSTTVRLPSVKDKYSADLAFWKIPPVLSNHGNPCLPAVAPVLTKKELNLNPTFEHVDVPKYIKKEKYLPNSLEAASDWKRISHSEKGELQDSRNTLSAQKPSTPEIADFVVIGGRRFRHVDKNTSHIPTISIIDTSCEYEDSEVESKRLLSDPDVVISLKINDFEVTVDEQSLQNPSESEPKEITFTLKFFTNVNQRSKKLIHFENQGTVAIAYHWRDDSHNSDIFPRSLMHDASFFFNKNEALLLPGQKIEFPIWFHKSDAGIFSEIWRMVIDPEVFRVTFLIHMWGQATSEYSGIVQSEIDKYLDRCIRNTAVRETIDEMIFNVRLSKAPEPSYKSRYLERELFREKNPSYFYHPSLVAKMYNLYTSAEVPGTASWTLSLMDLRHILLQFKNPELRNEMLTMFSDLCQQCLKPCLSNSIENTKYTVVYKILCALANRVEEESALVKLNCVFTDQESPIRTENVFPNSDERTEQSVIMIPGKKRSSKTSTSSENFSSAARLNVRPLLNDCMKTALYREVFYVRVYELLVEAVEQATAAMDSLNNLNQRES